MVLKYEEILNTLGRLDEWLNGLGISPKSDRIHQAIDVLREADEGWKEFRRSGKPSKIGNVDRYYFGLIETLEFYDIFTAFEKEQASVLVPKLSAALSGPFLPANETVDNAGGRNVMFELALGSEWRLRGLDVRIGEPDLTLNIQGARYLVECKRPFREQSIRPNIRAAAEQLKQKLGSESEANVFGIIAISVSRILNPGDRILTVLTSKDTRRLGDQLERMMHESERHWARLGMDPRIVAVLFHVATPGVVENEDRLYRMTYQTVIPVGGKRAGFEMLEQVLPPLYGEG